VLQKLRAREHTESRSRRSSVYLTETAHMKLATLPDGVWCGSALIHRPASAVSWFALSLQATFEVGFGTAQ
jgi:hypothetical protein